MVKLRKLILIYVFMFLYCRLLRGQPRLTQPVTQIVGANSMSLSDDLIQTKRMTIAELLQATQVKVVTIRNHDLPFFL